MSILKIPSTKQIRNVAEHFAAHVLSLALFHACNIAKIRSVKCTHSLQDQCLTEHCLLLDLRFFEKHNVVETLT